MKRINSKFYTILICIILIFVGYYAYENTLYPSNISRVLDKADNNAEELKLVLKHYKEEQDDLKYKAAEYLISNMDTHFSSTGIIDEPETHKAVFRVLDSAARNYYLHKLGLSPEIADFWDNESLPIIKTLPKIINNTKEITNLKSPVFDVNTIKADWLINHIDKAFDIWNRLLPSLHLNFEEFCETILPYRYDKEIINTPIGYSENLFKEKIFKNVSLNDIKANVDRLNFYFKNIRDLSQNINYKGDLGFYNILKWKQIECGDQSVIYAEILNNIGIPTVIDFTSHWLNRDVRHTWCVSMDSLGTYRPFSPGWQSIGDDSFFKRTSKIFRKTFAKQMNSAFVLKNKNEVVPAIFNTPHIKDVSDQYHNTIPLKIPINSIPKVENLAYLSIFSPKGWTPVGWGKIDKKNKEIVFEKVPTSVVYITGLYLEGKIQPISEPFYINKEGKMHTIVPDYTSKVTMNLIKKYPQKEQLYNWIKKLKGATFQGANNEDFSDAVDLYILPETPEPYVKQVTINNPNSYRHVRFKPKKGQLSYMAIMEYYSRLKKGEKPEKGTPPYILKKEDTLLLKNNDLTKVFGRLLGDKDGKITERLKAGFDGNIETFTNYKWAGIDLGKPTKIEAIRYAPRNANNMINVGDIYELLYYDQHWKSAGTKKAKYNFIEFNHIPSGALYWLKNLSKGKEELSFIYYNGKQLFVNNDNLEEYFLETQSSLSDLN